jgi:DNA-binding NtrC family response regulator
VLLLAEVFVKRFAREMGRPGLGLSEKAKTALSEHSWPGNVRELQNCLERAFILCDGATIEPAHLRLEAALRTGPTLADVVDLSGPLPEVTKRVVSLAEEEAIAAALRDTDGDRGAAATHLGISLSTLNRRLRKAEAEAASETETETGG